MEPRAETPKSVRPALLEAVLVVTSSAVAVISAIGGKQIGSTALTEFAMFSAISAASAAGLLARYAVQIWGLLADYRTFERWGTRLRATCYVVLAGYALLNGVLDVAVPRRADDPVWYPGLACAVGAVIVVALVLETKYRVLQSVPSRSLFESLSDDAFYLTIGVLTLVALIGHVFAPSWWLDTIVDAVFVALVALRLAGLRRSEAAAA